MKEKLMNVMNSEVKKVLERAKKAQSRLKTILEGQEWVEEARKYAEKQSKELKKLLSNDAGKLKSFLERERKELERLQKEIPGEVKKLKSFVQSQRKELEKLLKNLRRASKKGGSKRSPKGKSSTGSKTRKKASGTSTDGPTASA